MFLTWLDIVKGFFFHQGKNSAIIHFSCLPWSSRPSDVAKLHSTFLPFVPNCFCNFSFWFALFFQPDDDFPHLYRHLFGPLEYPITGTKCKFKNSRPFICLIYHGIKREQATPDHVTDQLSFVQLLLSL